MKRIVSAVICTISVAVAGCSFDDSHLSDFSDLGALDTSGSDSNRPAFDADRDGAATDMGAGDSASGDAGDPSDAEDGGTTDTTVADISGEDVPGEDASNDAIEPEDVSGDTAISDVSGEDVVSDTGAADTATGDTTDDTSVTDTAIADTGVDTTPPVDTGTPNEAPVLTVPDGLSMVRNTWLAVTGLSVSDADARTSPLIITVSVADGLLRLDPLPARVTLTDGTATGDNSLTFTATQGQARNALAALEYLVQARVVEDTLSITANDQGATGTGGAQQDMETVPIEVTDDGFDFNVQRATSTITATNTTETITAGVDYTQPTGPAFIRLVNTQLSGMGGGAGNQKGKDWMVWISDPVLDGDGVTFSRFGVDGATRVDWEIIEYTGGPDGPNAMLVHSAGVRDFGNSTTAEIAAISDPGGAPINDANVVVFVTGQAIDDGGANKVNKGHISADWDGDRNVAEFLRAEADMASTNVSYAVVEFAGSNWSVQRVEHTVSNPGSDEAVTIVSVGVDTSQAFLHVQHRSTDTKCDDVSAEVWLASDTEVRVHQQSGAANGYTATIWVVSNSQAGDAGLDAQHLDDNRGVDVDGVSSPDVWQDSIDSVPTSRTSIMGETSRVDDTGGNFPTGSINLRLSGSESVELIHANSAATKYYRYSVVVWPDG